MDEITKSEFKKLLAVVEETKNQSQDFKLNRLSAQKQFFKRKF